MGQGSLIHWGAGKWRGFLDHPSPPPHQRKQLSKIFYAPDTDPPWEEFDEWKVEIRKKYSKTNPDGKITIGALFNGFLEHCKKRVKMKDLAESTYTTYESVQKNYSPIIGSISAEKLSWEDMQSAIDYTVEDCDLSNTYVNYHYKVLKMVYNYGINKDLLAANIPKNLGPRGKKLLILPPSDLEEAQIFQDWQVDQLMDISVNNHIFSIIVFFSLNTGLRRGEQLGIQREHIFDDGRIDIKQQLQKKKGKFQLVKLKTKAARRTITLDPDTSKKMQQYLRMQDEQKKRMGKAYNDQGFVFCYENGDPIDPNLVTRWMREAVEKMGLKKKGYTFHTCRHTYVSHMIRSGVNIKEIASAVGHEDEMFTQKKYGHLFEDAKREAAARYGEYRQSRPIKSPIPD